MLRRSERRIFKPQRDWGAVFAALLLGAMAIGGACSRGW
jgi:hypothetical protein